MSALEAQPQGTQRSVAVLARGSLRNADFRDWRWPPGRCCRPLGPDTDCASVINLPYRM
jgi:hypothetical protein